MKKKKRIDLVTSYIDNKIVRYTAIVFLILSFLFIIKKNTYYALIFLVIFLFLGSINFLVWYFKEKGTLILIFFIFGVIAMIFILVRIIKLRNTQVQYVNRVSLSRKAAINGNAKAEFNLGIAYGLGHGVAKNYVKAKYWFKKSAKQGYANAQYYLGNIYFNGLGVARNYTKADYWYLKAAKQNNVNAEYKLWAAYKHGIGVPQNNLKAKYWYNKYLSSNIK